MNIKDNLKIKLASIKNNLSEIYRIAIISVLFIGFILMYTSLNQKQKEVVIKLENNSERIKKALSYDIDYVKYQLSYAATQIPKISNNKQKINDLLSNFFSKTNTQTDVALTWNAFSWINKNDKIIVDGTSGILVNPVDVADRDYLKFTKSSYNKMVFGKPIYGALSQRFLIPAAIGVFDDDGSYLGTLVFGFDIAKIISKIERSINNKDISFAFLQEGDLLFGSENFENDHFEIVKNEAKMLSLDESVEKGKISVQSSIFKDGINSYFQRIREYPIEFVMFYDQNSYHRQVIDIIFKQSVLVFVILFACIMLFRKIHKRIINPVSNLSFFAHKILEKDFKYEIAQPKGKELQELYLALRMLKNLIQREEDLVNQLKEANQKIAQENFNKSEFLSAISHDIRNPLSAIKSFTYVLQSDESSNKEEIYKEIDSCANDALQFINDLMDVTQASSGVFSVDMSQKINIHEMIKRSVRVNRDFAHKKNIKIINKADPTLKHINLDQRRVKQILINLINNSIKYSRSNTKIELFTKIEFALGEEYLKIIIKDEGMGMTQEQIKKAMVRFGLAKESQDKPDSFGIGLSLVKQLVELQNGNIEIDSKVGIGTYVTLTFKYKNN